MDFETLHCSGVPNPIDFFGGNYYNPVLYHFLEAVVLLRAFLCVSGYKYKIVKTFFTQDREIHPIINSERTPNNVLLGVPMKPQLWVNGCDYKCAC